MANEPENLIHRMLRTIDVKLDNLISASHQQGQRLNALELSNATIQQRLDAIDRRLDRLERRLGLVEVDG